MEMPGQVCDRASGYFFPPCTAASSCSADMVGSRRALERHEQGWESEIPNVSCRGRVGARPQ
jgi:hypothetical protein